jgi:4-carboxymuconolactone decarboxylase
MDPEQPRDDDGPFEKGLEQFRSMVGSEHAEKIRSEWQRVSPDFEQFVLSVLAGGVWTRKQLDLRTRSLITVTTLAALGRPRGLRLNIEMALGNGASREEIREALLHVAFYAGFPAAWEGLQVADEVFQEQDSRK